MHTTKLSILRHGEVQGGPVFRGSQDDPLTELGWQQMQERLSSDNCDCDIVLSSPLIRCANFAKQYCTSNNLSLHTIPEFKEIDFGDWEGKSYQQINQSTPQSLEQFYVDPTNNPPPNGEALNSFQKRVVDAVTMAVINNCGKNILLISHGGVQKIIIAHALKMPLEALHNIETPYACLTKLSIYQSAGNLSWILNQHGHTPP